MILAEVAKPTRHRAYVQSIRTEHTYAVKKKYIHYKNSGVLIHNRPVSCHFGVGLSLTVLTALVFGFNPALRNSRGVSHCCCCCCC